MRDITLKPTTLREARAQAHLSLPPAAIDCIRDKQIEKGDVIEAARITGLMAIKKTSEWLPHCHPIPILEARIDVTVDADGLRIEATVCTIAPTGVEMEALTAVSAAALCAYDMMKPHVEQRDMRISDVRLLEKRGGKSQFVRSAREATAVVIVLSDTVAAGKKPDTAGASVRQSLIDAGFSVKGYEVLPDEPQALTERLRFWIAQHAELLMTVGGTGLGPRDLTVEAVRPLLTREIPGVMEAARQFGQQRTPYAMLSRGIAGIADRSVIVTMPGSRRGAEETLAAILPGLVHLLDVQQATYRHAGGYR
jgi:cyclic pyranopterin monophosphate synthase